MDVFSLVARDDVPPVFLRLLLAGALEPREYAELLVQYREIYAALDRAAAAHAADDPRLLRLRAGIRAGLEDLEADLAVLLGPGWADPDAESPEVMPATRAYSACASAAAASVEGLVAHHLVRHAADGLGAGLIHLTLGEAYGPLAGRLAFHTVADSAGSKKPGDAAIADPSAWTREQRERVAAEAAVAGACDRALLDELGAALARR
ncbi:biliverdin-producing heme oxygenase [Actinospica robiniae]|uniref:biliverdin-producing heme oxygenase n=1 Tax=Actinospica robiniae TaxID=304901 RepID=UPI00146FA989|nr:biliverdin-producing heme oxygenase [Actinospica robiniae]